MLGNLKNLLTVWKLRVSFDETFRRMQREVAAYRVESVDEPLNAGRQRAQTGAHEVSPRFGALIG